MTNYPFLQFLSVVLIPSVYWVGIVEVGVLDSQDNAFSLTFGQVSLISIPVPLPVDVALMHLLRCSPCS